MWYCETNYSNTQFYSDTIHFIAFHLHILLYFEQSLIEQIYDS